MSEGENRLIRCFTSVFPGLSNEEIQNISVESEGAWDSLSAVTLAAVVQEEFNLEIDPEILPQLDSYKAFRAYLLFDDVGREVNGGA
jgi:acyl carrier protein